MIWKTDDPLPNECGLIQGLPDDLYHKLPGASKSRLWTMRNWTPRRMRHEMGTPRVATDAMALGAAIHDAVLLPDVFASRYAQAGQCAAVLKSGPNKGARCKHSGAGRYGGEWFCGTHTDPNIAAYPDPVTALKPDEWDACVGIRDAALHHSRARYLLEAERKELTALWTDVDSGVRCKGRLDVLSDDDTVITDVKSARSAAVEPFTRDIYGLGYFAQGAHYRAGARACGAEAEYFVIIAAEKEPPFDLAVYEVKGEALDAGDAELRPLLRQWARCEAKETWPGYPEAVTEVTLPPWAWVQSRERVARLETQEEVEV